MNKKERLEIVLQSIFLARKALLTGEKAILAAMNEDPKWSFDFIQYAYCCILVQKAFDQLEKLEEQIENSEKEVKKGLAKTKVLSKA